MNPPAAPSGPVLISFYGGPHDGDEFRVHARPARSVARSHRTGAGALRSVYHLRWCQCHGLTYNYDPTSEEPIS